MEKGLFLERLKLHLATVIDQRTIEVKPGHSSSPSKFCIVQREGRLKCVWAGNVLHGETPLATIHRPEKGYSSRQWDQLTRKIASRLKSQQEALK